MAYDEELARRVREIVNARSGVSERRMFGGLAWMVTGNMACCALGDDLVVRLEPEDVEPAYREPGVRPFGREGAKPMRGFVLVDAAALSDDVDLARWVDAGAARAASLPPK